MYQTLTFRNRKYRMFRKILRLVFNRIQHSYKLACDTQTGYESVIRYFSHTEVHDAKYRTPLASETFQKLTGNIGNV